jgi:cytochrome c peroxidase
MGPHMPKPTLSDFFVANASSETALIWRHVGAALTVVLLLGLAWLWLAKSSPQPAPAPTAPLAGSIASAREFIVPLPSEISVDPKKVELGKRLFHDARLSHDDSVSCASCHNLSKGGADGLRLAVGILGQPSKVNSPTVFNSGLNFRQFWDGRAATLDEQASGPVLNPAEMGSTWEEVIPKLRSDPSYVEAFDRIYAGGVQPRNVEHALASFERSLVTPDSRFDKYLKGEATAITADELKGYQLFQSYGCVACHQGANVGGNLFQKFGVMKDYFKARGGITVADLGRFNVTGRAEDVHVFKVPSLRNVALTAPYFHDGSAGTLEEAVLVMGLYQLGTAIPPADVELIVAFLRTLTGRYEGHPL